MAKSKNKAVFIRSFDQNDFKLIQDIVDNNSFNSKTYAVRHAVRRHQELIDLKVKYRQDNLDLQHKYDTMKEIMDTLFDGLEGIKSLYPVTVSSSD